MLLGNEWHSPQGNSAPERSSRLCNVITVSASIVVIIPPAGISIDCDSPTHRFRWPPMAMQ
ncbi:MAG: hypothetical protein ACREPZ_11355 [Rhodanobacteraceae bacterium]